MCTSFCVCGCVWSGLHASFSGMGVRASQSNPNLAKFGGGGQCRFCEAVCSDLVCDAGQSEIVTLSSRSVLKKSSGLGLTTHSPGPRSYISEIVPSVWEKEGSDPGNLCVWS